MCRLQSEYNYAKAREVLGLNVFQMAEVLDIAPGLWTSYELGEAKVPLTVHHFVCAMVEGYRTPNWPIEEDSETLAYEWYVIEVDLTNGVQWLPVLATGETDAKVQLALSRQIHWERMLTVKVIPC